MMFMPFAIDRRCFSYFFALRESRESRRTPTGYRLKKFSLRHGRGANADYNGPRTERGVYCYASVPAAPAKHWIARNAAANGYVEYPF